MTTAFRIKAKDQQFVDVRIKDVSVESTGWSIQREDGWSFFVPNKGIEPKRGMIARFYGKGIGRPVRGLDLDGREVFYRTPAQQEAAHRRWCANLDRKRQRDFEKNRAQLDAEYGALPDVFKQRIDRFRAGNPDFRWQHESYELFTCTQAVLIAEALKTPEAVQAFRDLPESEQRKRVPGLSDQHSGNTFDCAVALASWYLSSNPEVVARLHGALTPLVGCDEYGCTHEAHS